MPSNSVRFTSSKCPAREDATCALPFGLLWSPFMSEEDEAEADISLSSSSAAALGEICPTCLAYRNVYCTTTTKSDDDDDDGWVCPFCTFPVPSDPQCAHTATPPIIQDTVTYRQPVTQGSLPDVKTILLVVDGNLPADEARGIGTLVESIVAAVAETNIKLGLIVFDSVVSVYQLPTSSGMALCQDFEDYSAGAPSNGGEGEEEADIITDDTPYLMTVSPDSTLDPLWTCLAARFGFSLTSPTETSNSSNNGVKTMSRLERLKERKAARLRGQQTSPTTTIPTASTSAWSNTTDPSLTAGPPRRCTAAAIQCASDLLVSGDRLWLFTNGCPNTGPGNCCHEDLTTVDPHRVNATALPYFSLLGPSILDGVLVDVFCSGNNPLAVNVYQGLVEASAGYVSMVAHNDSPIPNARHLWQHTHASLGQFQAPPKAADADKAPPKKATWVEGCTADIRLSSCLTATHLIGPGELVSGELEPLANEQTVFDESLQRLLSKNPKLKRRQFPATADLLRIRLGRYDPLSTFSILMQLNDSYQPAFDTEVFVQVIIRYVDNATSELVTRVVTKRLKIAKDAGEFLEVIDEQVVPVVLGKEAVYRAMVGRGDVNDVDRLAYDAQRDLDQTVFQISAAFRLLSLEHGTKSIDLTEEGGVKAAGTSMDFAFPPELSDALRRLYHMRRGPFLSPGPLQSVDDRGAMRAYFVRFPLEDCLAMMAPALWSSGPLDMAIRIGAPLYDSVPPDTLSLWENRILAADHWHTMFIWSGGLATSPEYRFIIEHFRQFLLERSLHRFPAPKIHILTETDSMSRRFTALLSPLHGDPIEHQLAHFPALAQLTDAEQTKLHSRFMFYDPESDPSFRKWFWQVVSVSDGTVGSQGTSLCD